MQPSRELARLNLVLEMVTECAARETAEEVIRTVGARLRWIIDFASCELAFAVDDQVSIWTMGRADESFASVPGGFASAGGSELIEQALASRAPASTGRPISSAAHPVGSVDRSLGVLFLNAASEALSHRDLRHLQYVAASLGAVLSRIDRNRLLQEQRNEAVARDDLVRRERDARVEAEKANAAKDALSRHAQTRAAQSARADHLVGESATARGSALPTSGWR